MNSYVGIYKKISQEKLDKDMIGRLAELDRKYERYAPVLKAIQDRNYTWEQALRRLWVCIRQFYFDNQAAIDKEDESYGFLAQRTAVCLVDYIVQLPRTAGNDWVNIINKLDEPVSNDYYYYGSKNVKRLNNAIGRFVYLWSANHPRLDREGNKQLMYQEDSLYKLINMKPSDSGWGFDCYEEGNFFSILTYGTNSNHVGDNPLKGY